MKNEPSSIQDAAALIAHELRRPVSVILGYASMLLDGSLKNRPLRSHEAAQKIMDHGEEIEVLLNALVTALTGQDRREIIDLRATARLACQRMQDQIELEKAVLTSVGIDEQEEPLLVSANQAHILCILTGLIGNALLYSSQPARMVIRLLEKNDQAEIEVQDYGQGIPEPDRCRLFERDYPSSGKADCFGLGLSLSQEMAVWNGGRLRLKSSEPGKGSTFILTLPRAQISQDHAEVA
ncbi:MAG: sensor histidine kinase [Candidatus Dormibacteraceae bacterium]